MAQTQYSLLDTAKHEIRLVYAIQNSASMIYQTSTSGIEALPVRYGLKKVSLDERPLYTALSYVWGSTEDQKQIIIDGETLMVTQNLQTALQYLHREDRPEGLWVDSICINQDDEKEKTKQVQQMRSIYESANEVFVWLGTAGDNSDIVMDLFADIGKQSCEFGINDPSQPVHQQLSASETDKCLLALRVTLNRFIDKVGHLALIEAVTSFVAREWWKRVWVTQELAVAKNAIFGLGDKRVKYAYLYAAVFFWSSETSRIVLYKYKNADMLEMDKDQVLNALNRSSTYPAAAMLSYPRWYRGETSTKPKEIYSLLLEALIGGTDGFRLVATDNREYIYGLMGLADDVVKLGIVPDYSLEWTHVYINVARKLIQAGNVDIIALCQKKDFNISTDMPSWTPDWRTDIYEPIMEPFVAQGASIAKEFCASGKRVSDTPGNHATWSSEATSTHDSTVHDTPSIDLSRSLTLSGARVDIVQKTGEAYATTAKPEEDTLGLLSTLFSDIESFCADSAALKHQIYKSAERRKQAVWRTPIRDLERSLDLAVTEKPGRATEKSAYRYKKFRSLTKFYKCFQEVTAPPTPTHRATPRSGNHLWPTSRLWLWRSILVLQSIYFLADFFIARVNWYAKSRWWIRSWILLARGRLLDRDLNARNATREKIGSEWDAVLEEKPDAYCLTLSTTYDRRPFLTSRGYVGLGPKHLTEGDVICVLHRGTVPFILRPRQEEEGGGYCVVGEAYVDGIMDGEFMDAKHEIEQFVLY